MSHSAASERSPLAEAAAVAVSAAALKLLFLASVLDNPFVAGMTNDEAHHLETAAAILAAGPLQGDAFYFAPLYPYLLAALFAVLGEHPIPALALQAVLGGLHVGLVHLLGWRFTGRRWTARIAAAAALLYGPYWMYETLLLKTTAAATLTAATVVMLLAAGDRSDNRRWAAGGLMLGVLALLRGNTLVVAAAVAAGLLLEHRRGRASARAVALWGLALVCGILPATLHNLVAASDLVPTTAQGGVQLWIGNHEGATGTYVALRPGRGLPAQERADAFSVAEAAEGQPLFPSEVSAWWLRRSLEWIADDPLGWLRLTAVKLRLLHAHSEVVDVVDIGLYRRLSPQLRLAWLGFGPVVALAAAGVVLERRRLAGSRAMLAFLLVGSIASVVLFFVFARYRLPFVSLYLVLAAAGVEGVAAAARRRRLRPLVAALAAAGTAGVVAAVPVRVSDPAVAVNTLGNLYRQLGRPADALRCFESIVARHPSDPRLRVNLAEILAELSRPCDAADELETALPAFARHADASDDPVARAEALWAALRLLEHRASCPGTRPPVDARAVAARMSRQLAADVAAGALAPNEGLARQIKRGLALAGEAPITPAGGPAADGGRPTRPPAAAP